MSSHPFASSVIFAPTTGAGTDFYTFRTTIPCAPSQAETLVHFDAAMRYNDRSLLDGDPVFSALEKAFLSPRGQEPWRCSSAPGFTVSPSDAGAVVCGGELSETSIDGVRRAAAFVYAALSTFGNPHAVGIRAIKIGSEASITLSMTQHMIEEVSSAHFLLSCRLGAATGLVPTRIVLREQRGGFVLPITFTVSSDGSLSDEALAQRFLAFFLGVAVDEVDISDSNSPPLVEGSPSAILSLSFSRVGYYHASRMALPNSDFTYCSDTGDFVESIIAY